MATMNKIVFNPEEDEDDYLPVGAHLLPQEFQDFLCNWNKTIAGTMGDWLGEPRHLFDKIYPEVSQRWKDENRRLSKLYATELAALKAYQKEWLKENAD